MTMPTGSNGAATGGPGDRPLADEAGFDAALCGVTAPLETLSFEELVAALESVTARLANGELGIEAAADLYEQAEILHAAAEARLAAVEARIERMRAQR